MKKQFKPSKKHPLGVNNTIFLETLKKDFTLGGEVIRLTQSPTGDLKWSRLTHFGVWDSTLTPQQLFTILEDSQRQLAKLKHDLEQIKEATGIDKDFEAI